MPSFGHCARALRPAGTYVTTLPDAGLITGTCGSGPAKQSRSGPWGCKAVVPHWCGAGGRKAAPTGLCPPAYVMAQLGHADPRFALRVFPRWALLGSNQ